MRGRAFTREQRNRAIAHKKHICNKRDNSDWFRCDGMYSKGSITCGCGLCKPTKRFRYPSFRDERLASKFKQDCMEYGRVF